MVGPEHTVADAFSRNDIREEFPFLDDTDRTMVVGGDIDAILSAVFLHHELGWEVSGFYTGFENIYYTDEDAIQDAVWVDLDVSRQDLRSIGHHIVRTQLDDELTGLQSSLNLNEIRGVYKENFTRKYPLGTIHFLLWFYGVNELTPLQKAFLLSADSTWINAQHYTDNVTDWIENCLPSQWLIDAVEDVQTQEFEHRIAEEVYPRIESTGFSRGSSSGRKTSTHLNLSGWQCSFEDPTTEKVANLIDLIGEIMDWETFSVPSDMQVEHGSRQGTTYAEVRSHYDDMDTFLRETNTFSFAIPSTYRSVRINHTTDVSF
ncbi:hypothetical protein [Halorubrum ezzemoulense]|uniref:hypothetical protein n=1 Tax=Halorubrum ezzemoulense TaxID=337243 RepID=UPI00232E89AF|nr:hypothetical protein [Halorubrum ezzemoulense]MDB2239209.1 hypothetical protein [Halorubrum ezzemoulense]